MAGHKRRLEAHQSDPHVPLVKMEVQASDLLCRVADLIASTIQRSGFEERRDLQQALTIFMRCASRGNLLDYETTQELEEQIAWLRLYEIERDRRPTYRAPAGGSLVPVTEDVEHLMSRFAKEVLQGARAIEWMLRVPPKEMWSGRVRRRRRRRRAGVNPDTLPEPTESTEASDSTESREDESDNEVTDEAIEYSAHAYF